MSNDYGIVIFDSSGNNIVCNTISGNTTYGLEINGPLSTGNQVWGNQIGPATNGSGFPSGSSDPSNPWLQQTGILIKDAAGITIGGTLTGACNVIAGNDVGIEISGFDSSLTGTNFIEGNSIGVTENGSPIGNLYGIWINGVPNNIIADNSTPAHNSWAGVYISGLDATGNFVEYNTSWDRTYTPKNKGTKTDPTSPLPTGVFIGNSSLNTIGGAGAGNTIYGNNVGVYIVGTGGLSTNNQVLGNFIGLSANGGSPPGNVLYGVMLVNAPNNNAPQSGPSANKIVGSGIANYREYSGPIDPTTQSSSGSKAKKPAIHSDHVAHQTPRRTALHAQVTVHGHTVPAGPLGKPRARVRH